MSPRVYSLRHQKGQTQESFESQVNHGPIPLPSSDIESLRADGDSFTFDRFTAEDAWILGNLLRARLLPFSGEKPTLISIALANTSQVIFQCAVGSGTMPDNEHWVRRKRNAVLRWGCSTWFLHCKFKGDEDLFRAKHGMDPEQAAAYAIHGGGVPIRVKGVEGVIAVVVVSGLKQSEDHGVIGDVIKSAWQEV